MRHKQTDTDIDSTIPYRGDLNSPSHLHNFALRKKTIEALPVGERRDTLLADWQNAVASLSSQHDQQ